VNPSPEIPPPPAAPPDASIADLPLEKLSVEAERAMAGALQIAIDAHQAYLGTEHLLLGVLGQESCLGALALQSLGVTPEYVTARLPPVTGPINTTTPIPTTRLANALMQSMLGSPNARVIDSRVLVDAVIDGDGIGGLILGDAGVTPEQWQVATLALGTGPQETALERFSPAFRRLWTQRGLSRLRMNRADNARADFVLVMESATTDGEVGIAANNLAWTDLCIGDANRFRDALELAERAAAKLPNQRYVRGTLAFALIENDRIGEGVDILVGDSIQGEDDGGTAARACVLAIGVARLGRRPYAEVLLNLAEQLGGPSTLLARVGDEISKAPSEPAAPASVSEGSVAATVESLRLHRKLGKHVLVLRGADRRVYPIWVAAGAAERIRSLIVSPTELVPGRRDWVGLLLAAVRSRGAEVSAILMDRMVADAFHCTISVTEGGGWAFEVSPSDAAAIASSTGLPIRVSAELWGRYSMSDPRLESNIRRIIRWIFRRQ
jgi:bifunctional DNase/RNase